MSRLHGATFLLLGVVFAHSWLTRPAPAQTPDKTGPRLRPPAAMTIVEPIRLPDDARARQRLAAVRDYIEQKSWGESVRLLQSLLDAKADSFQRVSYRDKRGETSQRWTSIRAEAEQLLARLPPAGKELYLLSYDAKARKELTAARARRDLVALHELTRRYRYTSAGVEALELLGSHYLDRGHADCAAACYQRLLQHPGADKLSLLTLFKAALAAQVAGVTRAGPEQAWQKLVRRLGDGGLRIGQETYNIEKLRQIIDRWPGASVDNSPLYRGDSRRSARGRGDFFLLKPLWRIDLADGEVRQWLRQAAGSAAGPVLPAAATLAFDYKLIYRGPDGLHALDAQTGRPLWHSPSSLSLGAVLRDPGKKVQMRSWLRTYGPAAAVLLENTTLGTLSSDERRIYAVEDLPVPPHPELLGHNEGVVRSLGPLRHVVGHNRLRALDAATGARVWEIGGPSLGNPKSEIRNPKSDSLLTDAYFLGPPLPLGGELFALVEKQQEVNLVCLDAERGTVRWAQMLAAAPEKMLFDVPRHTQAAHLAYTDGVLVCPTHSGAILGVDPLSRGLVWAHVYAQPRTVNTEEAPGTLPAHVRGGWKGCVPIIHAGRVVFTAPDAAALYCLDLHTGSLLWKMTRTEEDLYVGCVHKGQVLLVGKTVCRALSMATGETLWQRQTGLPSGQGIVAGSIYYLPLKRGAIFAVNLDRPGDSVRIEAHGALKGDLGNLLFHRGVLWSQSAGEVMALTPLTTQLARVEHRLARSPRDPLLLFERGRLRLDKGDVAGAVADLHDAVASNPPPARLPAMRDRLFSALTQLLQRDFAAGQKYLEEYKALCRVSVPASAGAAQRLALEKEQRRRQTQYLALVALGRESQGRVLDALRAYRDLSRRPAAGERMTVPDDPAVQTRPDLWVQGRVAALLARANPPQRQLVVEQVRQEWRAVSANADRFALRRFLALFGAIQGEAAPLAREARLRLARELTGASGRRHALEAELLLDGLRDPRSNFDARALHAHALLLTRHGLLDEAVACYRRLAREHGRTVVHDGKTGAQLLDELCADKRFLAHVELPVNPWARRKLKPIVMARGVAVSPLCLPCLPCQTVRPGDKPSPDSSGTCFDLVGEMPDSYRHLLFTVDGRKLQLKATDRNTGAERYTIPLPLAGVPPFLRGGEVRCQAVDHVLVLSVGPTLLGVDLLDRRVRWSRRVADVASGPLQAAVPLSDGGLLINPDDPRLMRRTGLIGPLSRSAICVQSRQGLTALDPASGEVRWQRTDVPETLAVFGDREYLFLVDRPDDGSVRTVRAVRASDGVSVPIPDAAASYAKHRRILGRHLLVVERGTREELNLRLYDPLTGKDLWRMTARPGSFVLHSPQPRWLGIAEPDGTVTVVDLSRRKEVVQLRLDARHLDRVRDGCLLADHEQFYVALRRPIDPALKIVDEPHANFGGRLASVPVNGMLYAFDRAKGERNWLSSLPAQMLLLEQFEDLPIILCSASTNRASPMDRNNSTGVIATRSLDKRTGKLLHNREVAQVFDPFHTLQIDARSGAIDLISRTQKLRHVPE